MNVLTDVILERERFRVLAGLKIGNERFILSGFANSDGKTDIILLVEYLLNS